MEAQVIDEFNQATGLETVAAQWNFKEKSSAREHNVMCYLGRLFVCGGDGRTRDEAFEMARTAIELTTKPDEPAKGG